MSGKIYWIGNVRLNYLFYTLSINTLCYLAKRFEEANGYLCR